MRMKSLASFLALTFLAAVTIIAADRSPIYPFDVKIGGKLAAIEGDPEAAIFAKIKEPVAADAEIEVSADPGMLIVNVFPVKADGSVEETGAPKVLVAQGANKVKLTETMDKSRLEPGLYGANIVLGEATARVMFTVR